MTVNEKLEELLADLDAHRKGLLSWPDCVIDEKVAQVVELMGLDDADQ